MRYGRLKRYLKKWQDAGFISAEQAQQIAQYMKVESHRQFLKLIRVLFIMGAFWLLFGLIAALKLINVEILKAIGRFLSNLVTPLIALARLISPEHYRTLLSGAACLAGWGLFHWLAMRLRRRSDTMLTRLGYLQEKELRLGTSTLTMGYLLASIAWQCFNYVTYPSNPHSYWGKEIIVPWFSFIGLAFFLTIAYRMKDQIALLFGIGFLAHAVGLFTAYTFATYWIGVRQPVIQLIMGVLLIFIGLWHIEKVRGREDHFQFLFGRTYEWTGLLFGYLSLWIMSIWGIAYRENYWAEPAAIELWAANVLFIAGAIGALFYGAAKEDRMFFNFGLTFLIIESYTVFFSHIWETLGAAFGSLSLGALLIGTGYLLRHLWFQGRIFKKPAS
jgi:hypothetical protein